MTRVPRPLSELSPDEAKCLTGLVFDIDDTVLDHGALTEEAYAGFFRLREAGLRLVACTGRSAGFCEVLLRQWPIDAAVAENGAVGLVKQSCQGRAPRVETIFPTNLDATRAEHEELLQLARELVARFPDTAFADDNAARWTDVALDIGEYRSVGSEMIAAIRADATSRGVTTFVSSVHVHLSCGAADKASGTLRLLDARFGESRETARVTNAFVGDSGNDAAAFSVFQTTFGVSNVMRYLPCLTDPPRFIMKNAMGMGFAELAAHLAVLRRGV